MYVKKKKSRLKKSLQIFFRSLFREKLKSEVRGQVLLPRMQLQLPEAPPEPLLGVSSVLCGMRRHASVLVCSVRRKDVS